MAVRTLEMPMLERRAALVPSSINEKEHTIDFVWSTGARVRRSSWYGDHWDEELGMLDGEVRLGRLNAGANICDAHELNLESIVGRIVPGSARVVNGQGIGTMRLSDHASLDRVWHDVRSGIICWMSSGYRVYKWRDVTTAQDEVTVLRAVDWEPGEVSFVGWAADGGSATRSGARGSELFKCEVDAPEGRNGARTMPNPEGQNPTPATPPVQVVETRVAPAAAPAPAPAATAVVDDTASRAAGATAERTRIAEITKLVKRSKIPADKQTALAQRLIDSGASLDASRAAVIDEWAGAEPPTQAAQVSVTREEHEGSSRSMQEALLHRFNPVKYPLAAESQAREYRGMSLMEMGKESLRIRGISHRNLGKMEVAGLALRAGTHTSADFPNVLANVAGKTLRDAYTEAPQTFRSFMRRATAPDFKQVSRVQLGEAPNLVKVNEAGEYTYGTVGEGSEKYALGTYGKILAFTRQMMINDDLDAFSRIPSLMGKAAMQMESDVAWAIMTANAAMADTVALFHATHANLGDKVLGLAGLDQLYQLIALQKGLAGRFLNLIPKFVIVPPQLATTAWQLCVATTQPATDATTNPFKGRLEPIVEPRLSTSAIIWFMACDSATCDTVEYAFLEGEEGPVVETRLGFDTDGVEIKVREDFAAKAIDHRGMAKSSGTV